VSGKTTTALLFVVSVFVAFLAADSAFAERTFTIRVGEDAKCEKLSLPWKPPPARYNVERIWVQRAGVVKHSYDEDRGVICFEPQRAGTTRIRVSGTIYDMKPDGRLRWTKSFYRSFKVRVRSAAVN
jgi:hypothetical protein